MHNTTTKYLTSKQKHQKPFPKVPKKMAPAHDVTLALTCAEL
jgi:hypothetical protein